MNILEFKLMVALIVLGLILLFFSLSLEVKAYPFDLCFFGGASPITKT